MQTLTGDDYMACEDIEEWRLIKAEHLQEFGIPFGHRYKFVRMCKQYFDD